MSQPHLRSGSRSPLATEQGERWPQRARGEPRLAPASEQSLNEELRRLLLRNVREGYSTLLGQHYCYIAPSPQTYPFQWFWDTCFHVLILTQLREYERAKRNLRSLFAMQAPDGFVGHMIFWHQLLPTRHTDVLQAKPTWENLRPHMSGLIQPTFAAYSLLRLFNACGDRVYLGEMYARLKRYHDWLAQNRDFDGDSLLTIISPFESGMDWKPSYDPVLEYAERTTPLKLYRNKLYWKGVGVDLNNFLARYDLRKIRQRRRFLVKDVAFNVIYAHDLGAMETLAGIVGDADESAYRRRRLRVENSVMSMMYDEADAAFFDLHMPDARRIRVMTPTILFPLALESVPESLAEQLLQKHLSDCSGFSVNFPLPSVAIDDPAFYAGESPFIWRGPMWAFLNWFLFHAFKRRGYEAQAQRLKGALAAAIAQSGFREYYNPFNGQGYGATDFTWSGLIVDMV